MMRKLGYMMTYLGHIKCKFSACVNSRSKGCVTTSPPAISISSPATSVTEILCFAPAILN